MVIMAHVRQGTSRGESRAREVDYKFFEGGTLNACYNCVDRHVEAGFGDRAAFLYEANDVEDAHRVYTYAEVRAGTARTTLPLP